MENQNLRIQCLNKFWESVPQMKLDPRDSCLIIMIIKIIIIIINNNKLTVWVVDGVNGLSGELVLSSVDKESEQEAELVWEARVNVQEVPPTSEHALVLTVSK